MRSLSLAGHIPAVLPLVAMLFLATACTQPAGPTTETPANPASETPSTASLPENPATPSETLVVPPLDGRVVTDPNDLVATNADPATPVACKTDAAFSLLGKPASETTVQDILKDSGAASVRVLKPGDAATRDFRADRLTINIDADNNITSVACG